jgi:hypothetical protein
MRHRCPPKELFQLRIVSALWLSKLQSGRQRLARQNYMKQVNLSMPQLGLIVLTRGMLAAGGMLLIAERLSQARRKQIGWPLVAIGAVSTIPLALGVIHNIKEAKEAVAQAA